MPKLPPRIGPGLRCYSNSRARCISLDYWARPDFTKEWARDMRAMLGRRRFETEFMKNWDTTGGAPFYPEFAEDPDTFLQPFKRLLMVGPNNPKPSPILRGWDFGGRHPVVTVGQWSERQATLWYYREVGPRDIRAHDMRDLVRFLCGQITEEQLKAMKRTEALAWLDRERRTAEYGVPIPWFPPGCDFVDFSKNEANKRQSISGQTDSNVLAESGIHLYMTSAYALEDAETVMRFLMSPNPITGRPYLVVDPACKRLVEAFKGGLAYPKKGGSDPAKDGFYDDFHDAASYMATGICPLKAVSRLKEMQRIETPMVSTPGQAPPPQAEDDQIRWAEVTHSRWN